MMTAAKVYPLAAFQPLIKFRQHLIQCTLQHIGILFAHRVKMNAVQPVKTFLFHLFQRYTHAGTGNAGVV